MNRSNLSKKILFAVALALAAQFSSSVFADDSTTEASKTKADLSGLHKEAEKAAASSQIGLEEDPDSLITNQKMRAESGSKSKYSISVNMNYSGGSLEKPLGTARPNITQGAALTNYSSIDGTIAAKMNLSKVDSLSLGVGVRAVTPFSKNTPEGAGQRLNAADPSLLYQKISKLGGMQSVFVVGPTFYTNKDVRASGTLGDLTASEVLAYDFGGSRFTIGASLGATARGFDKSKNTVCSVDEDGNETLCGSQQSDYSFGAYPFAEYQFSDSLSLRTITGLYVYDHIRAENRPLTFFKNVIYQSVGVGISVSRDIYVYPNIQFIPEDIRSDRTNVALNTTFNLF